VIRESAHQIKCCLAQCGGGVVQTLQNSWFFVIEKINRLKRFW
jgi:hypothetical protein